LLAETGKGKMAAVIALRVNIGILSKKCHL
jgi:hypothetical protein